MEYTKKASDNLKIVLIHFGAVCCANNRKLMLIMESPRNHQAVDDLVGIIGAGHNFVS